VNNHRKGWAWRRQIELWMTEHGFTCTTRGVGFSGDDIYAQLDGLRLSVEAKNHLEIRLSEFTDQAVRQAAMYPPELGVLPIVVIHRKGRPDPANGYVVLPGWAFLELVRARGA